jgi:acyl-CoA synthetase (AMP-forming)/AMP-acid ligase II
MTPLPQPDLATLHEAIAAELADRPCLVATGRVYSWREITASSRRLAAVLRRSGLGFHAERAVRGRAWTSPHDHLALYLHNGPEYLETLLGAHKARVAPFNTNFRYTVDELAALFADAAPRAIVYHARFARTLAAALECIARPRLLLQVADDSGNALLPGALDYDEALAEAPPAELEPRPSPDDLHLLYTGGTTGAPKGVMWRIGDLVNGPLGVRDRAGEPLDAGAAVRRALATGGRVISGPPFMHGAGTWFALGGWLSGAAVVLQRQTRRFEPADLLDTCERERVTSVMVVGDAFAAPLVDELRRRPRDLSALRVVLNSGAPMRPELKRALEELIPSARLVDTLGSSETGQQATRSGHDGGAFQPRGRAVVLNEDRTRPLPPGADEIGWLAQSGAIPLGYHNDEAKTAATFLTIDGTRYAVPGDRARLLADGSVELLGRDSTTINTGGEKVFAEEVEAALRSLPGVADALVVGRPSPRWGQEIVALVQAGAGRTVDDDDLRSGCARQLARYKIPKHFVRVPEIRRHPNGKPDYRWAQRTALEAA